MLVSSEEGMRMIEIGFIGCLALRTEHCYRGNSNRALVKQRQVYGVLLNYEVE